MIKISPTIFIYTLSDPRDNLIRYVGVTKNPKQRLRDHIKELKNNTRKTAWVKSLKKEGLNPNLEILEESSLETWQEDEIFFIELLRSWGFDLTNTAAGGLGNIVWNNEMREKLSKSMTGKKLSDERKRQMSEYNNYVYNNGLRKLPKTSKPIFSYNDDGLKISSYPSSNEAAKQVKGDRRNIERSTKNGQRVKGMRWSFTDLPNISPYIKTLFIFTENRKRALAEYNSRRNNKHV